LGTTRIKLGLLTIFYLFFAFIFQYVVELDAVMKMMVIPGTLYRSLVIVPLAFLSVCFYYWTLLSLIRMRSTRPPTHYSGTVQQLTLRQQALKLQTYKAFLGVLSVTALFFFASALYQVYSGYAKKGKKHFVEHGWESAWLEDALTETLFFGVLFSVAFLWRPRANNTHFG
jgi:hypothetical protein